MQSAFKKGRAARRRGKPRISNPYRDHRTYRGTVTFSRAFIRYFDDGWDYEDQEMQRIADARRRVAESKARYE